MPSAWVVKFELPDERSSEIFTTHFEEFFESIAFFENDITKKWFFEAYSEDKPEKSLVEHIVKSSSSAAGVNVDSYQIEQLPDNDWVRESQKSFKAIDAGRFFIYPSWHEGALPHDKIIIQIDPERAFGTGAHETTRGCLLAIDEVFQTRKFENILDMGCGSGLLAIAASKVKPDAQVLGVDIDPISVETSIKNAAKNHVDKICFSCGDGYNAKEVIEKSLFDLIIANILAAPLIEMAPMLYKNLQKNGIAILSGILVKQAESVIVAHEKLGMKLVKRNDFNEWSVLILAK